MESGELETFLAKLYTDKKFLEKFIHQPEECFKNFYFNEEEKKLIKMIDKESLILSHKVYFQKKEFKNRKVKKDFFFSGEIWSVNYRLSSVSNLYTRLKIKFFGNSKSKN